MKEKKKCFLDTEFNALDYARQNGGVPEITEIGAVVMEDGKVIDRFSRYCKLRPGHFITNRCEKITGITQKKINKQGVPFVQAMEELSAFLEKHEIQYMYTFGAEDEKQLKNTAKINRADRKIWNMFKNIRDIYPFFEGKLGLHYLFSLSDLCAICNVDTENSHSAEADAMHTGMVYYNILKRNVNKELLREVNVHKYNVGLYRKNRGVTGLFKRPEEADKHFIEQLEQVFASMEGKVNEPLRRAMHDNMVRLIGRVDLEIGEDGL